MYLLYMLYCIKWNVTEFAEFWMDQKCRSVHIKPRIHCMIFALFSTDLQSGEVDTSLPKVKASLQI